MREEDLIGHLIDALDPAEARDLHLALADPDRGPELRRRLGVLQAALRPLGRDRESPPSPVGLADRTIRFVRSQTTREAAPRPAVVPGARSRPADDLWQGPGARRRWIDRAIMVASALAACVLVVPMIRDLIDDARDLRAERKLQRLSEALHGYADAHRIYPTPPGEGPLSRAGLYAPTLVSEHRLVADDGTVLSPDSPLARRGDFRVPSLEELRGAVGTPGFDEVVKSMGGNYGYTLGHRDEAGVLQPNRDRRRAHHPLMADAPAESCETSVNHPEGIHHILFEDGRIRALRAGSLHADDHLYRNHEGEAAAGTDEEDAVIGASDTRP